jgi:type I restriction enzyme M protein
LQALESLIPHERPFEHFQAFLESVLEQIRPRGILLMLDEFDKLQEGIDHHITSPQVPENIRYLLHSEPDLAAILTGSRRLKRLREEYWSALFGIGSRIEVGPLPFGDAVRLVTDPVKGRLVFVPGATDYIVKVCACQPFLIQSLCNRLFDQAAERGDRTITVSAVKFAAEDMVRDNEHFATLWEYSGTEVRRLILQLCVELEAAPDIVTSELIQDRLRELGVSQSASGFAEDLVRLRELEVLSEHNDGGGLIYGVAIPLMADWIRKHIDFKLQVDAARREAEELL